MCLFQPAWWCLILSLLPLEIQPRYLTLTATVHKHGSSLSLPEISRLPESTPPIIPSSHLPVARDNKTSRQRERVIIWRSLVSKGPTPRWPKPLPDQNYYTPEEGSPSQRGRRARRHTHYHGGRAPGQLMRVGCVLGTCQVQNLTHRLYQLIGQSGREDSSPINPRSPHSYG